MLNGLSIYKESDSSSSCERCINEIARGGCGFRENLLGNCDLITNNETQTKSKQRQLRARRRGHSRTRDSLGFVPVLSRASFVPLEVDARAKRVHCPCVHLVKRAADVHMDSGGTVSQ